MRPEPPSARTRVRRLSERGHYDRAVIDPILDEGIFCHVGFVHDDQPFVVPTLHARVDDRLFLHGSAASRMLRTVGAGHPVCVTVTLLDGLVLARSAFDHSANYRSVMLLGRAHVVEDPDEKMAALEAFTEHVMPGRWADIRHPNPKELKATTVLVLPIEEASAKVRTGPPTDQEEDLDWPAWAGVLPLALTPAAPVTDPDLRNDLAPPDYVTRYRRGLD